MRTDSLALALCGILAATNLIGAQVPIRDSIITVSSQRTTRIAPDRVSFFIVVEGSAETAPDAVARVETKLRPVLAGLKGLGSMVEMSSPVAYSVGSASPPVGYPVAGGPLSQLARSVIRVQSSHPDQLTKVIATAIAAGASSATGMTFESTLADSIRRARIAEALTAAREEAEAIARAVGGRLGPLVEVTTGGSPGPIFGPSQFNLDNRFGSQGNAPEVTISSTVTVRYHLVH